jgi:hypothetical protein
MKKRKFLIPIAVALSALAPNAGASTSATPDSHLYAAGIIPKGPEPLTVTQPTSQELFGFVLKASEGGEIFAGHRSHRSHRSHSSHRSHYSSR